MGREQEPGIDWPTDPNNAEENARWAKRRGWLAESIIVSGSPVEGLFLSALFASRSFGPRASGAPWVVSAQKELRANGQAFFVDVALSNGALNVAVELDGHAFHERTPQQVEEGNQRQRAIEALGWRFVRFSGREVWRSPNGCVKALVELLGRWAEETKKAERPELSELNEAEARGDTETVNRLLAAAQSRTAARLRRAAGA